MAPHPPARRAALDELVLPPDTIARVQRALRERETLLLHGASGTGKSALARAACDALALRYAVVSCAPQRRHKRHVRLPSGRYGEAEAVLRRVLRGYGEERVDVLILEQVDQLLDALFGARGRGGARAGSDDEHERDEVEEQEQEGEEVEGQRQQDAGGTAASSRKAVARALLASADKVPQRLASVLVSELRQPRRRCAVIATTCSSMYAALCAPTLSSSSSSSDLAASAFDESLALFRDAIELQPPSPAERREILTRLMRACGMPPDAGADAESLARRTAGYTAADLRELMRMYPRLPSPLPPPSLLKACPWWRPVPRTAGIHAPPSDGAAPLPLDALYGLHEAKATLRAVLGSGCRARRRVNVRGVLLHGPSGNGKSALAAAVAQETEANFLYVDAAEIVSSLVGASERAMKQVFDAARLVRPAVLFFDHIEMVAPARDFARCDEHGGGDGGGEHGDWASAGVSGVHERLLSVMLQAMDGFAREADRDSECDGRDATATAAAAVVVLGATEQKWRVDRALLRPGRLELHVEVGAPDADARRTALMDRLTRLMRGDSSSSLSSLSRVRQLVDGRLVPVTDGMSMAQLLGACDVAAQLAIRGALAVEHAHDSAHARSDDGDDDDGGDGDERWRSVAVTEAHLAHAFAI